MYNYLLNSILFFLTYFIHKCLRKLRKTIFSNGETIHDINGFFRCKITKVSKEYESQTQRSRNQEMKDYSSLCPHFVYFKLYKL